MENTHRILCLVGGAYEDLELHYPVLRLREEGHEVILAGPKARTLYKGKHGYPVDSDVAFQDISPDDFDGLIIPGGWMPDRIRRDPKVLEIVRAINESKKLVASICHGPQIDISAGIVKGCTYTSSPGIKDDLINAGAEWVDEPVVIDGHHVTSRNPNDLPEFCRGILEVL